MNNTKWRELFILAIQYDLHFQSSESGRTTLPDVIQTLPPPNRIGKKGIEDPGLSGGGPTLYKEINWIRFPKAEISQVGQDRQSVRQFLLRNHKNSPALIEAFKTDLLARGQFPVNDCPGHLEITNGQGASTLS